MTSEDNPFAQLLAELSNPTPALRQLIDLRPTPVDTDGVTTSPERHDRRWKLTLQQRAELVERYLQGEAKKALAREFGIGVRTVRASIKAACPETGTDRLVSQLDQD